MQLINKEVLAQLTDVTKFLVLGVKLITSLIALFH